MAADLVIELRDNTPGQAGAGRPSPGQPGYAPPAPTQYRAPAMPVYQVQPPAGLPGGQRPVLGPAFTQPAGPVPMPGQLPPQARPALGPAFRQPPQPDIPPVPNVALEVAPKGKTEAADKKNAAEAATEKTRDARVQKKDKDFGMGGKPEGEESRGEWWVRKAREGMEAFAAASKRIGAGDPGVLADGAQAGAKGVAEKLGGEKYGKLAGATTDALIGAVRGLNDGLMQTADRLAEYSGEVAGAKAQAEVAQILGDLRRGQELGTELARLTEANSRLSQASQDVMAKIMAMLAPMITRVIESLASFMEFVIEAINWWNGEDAAGLAGNEIEELNAAMAGGHRWFRGAGRMWANDPAGPDFGGPRNPLGR